jgi:hypothetical protein
MISLPVSGTSGLRTLRLNFVSSVSYAPPSSAASHRMLFWPMTEIGKECGEISR